MDYAYPWSHIVIQLKGDQGQAWARPMAEMMWRALLAHFQSGFPPIWTPIPLHPSKLLTRGHNQAWALAQALGRCAQGRATQTPRLIPDLLHRVREGLPQHELPHAARWTNMRHSFALNPMALAPIQRALEAHPAPSILLIDDVFTTGATVNAAAQLLRQTLGCDIHVAVFARTRRRSDS